MKVDRKQKRLKAIKEVYPLIFERECKCCKEKYIKEQMFKVDRWGVNNRTYTWNYCKHCMPTKEDVLNEIDTDACIFGIAFVDEQVVEKTDYTKINKIRNSMIGR